MKQEDKNKKPDFRICLICKLCSMRMRGGKMASRALTYCASRPLTPKRRRRNFAATAAVATSALVGISCSKTPTVVPVAAFAPRSSKCRPIDRRYWQSPSAPSVKTKVSAADTVESSLSPPRSVADRWNALDNSKQIQSLLVVGDGDLSHCASIAPLLADLGISLTATVLEDQETHHATYKQSRQHTETISSHELHGVQFGIDATIMHNHFPSATFDRIQFNFPHWRGKANNRYNRELLDKFLTSAADHLSDGGEIHVALCEGQGGGTAETKKEWRESWKAAEYACMNGLLLRDVSPYLPSYDLSSHRGMDRSFKVGKVPKNYVFSKPDGDASVKTKESLQLCCRHELHINLPPEGQGLRSGSEYSVVDFVEGSAIKNIIQNVVVDPGIRVEVPMRRILTPEESGSDVSVAVFLVIYCGEATTLIRDQADGYRAALEKEVQKHLPLRSNRAGRLVSRPFPYPLLNNLVYHYLQPKA